MRDVVVEGEGDDDHLPEGYMQLHSFFIPGLVYGTYEIATDQVAQTLPARLDTLTLKNNPVVAPSGKAQPQVFDVLVPQFSLPAGAVHSYFPPSGQPADANILPHIVFNDPHLPWECPVGPTARVTPVSTNLPLTPWLALFVFTQDELRLTPAEMAAISPKISQQSAMLDVPMTAADFLLLDHAAVPNFKDASQPSGLDEKIDGTDAVNAIFIKTRQFVSLFANQSGPPTPPQSVPYLDRYQQLAHVRNVNTLHTTDAGTQDQGTFSVVISSRTGPLDTAQTTDLLVHLVSLENVDKIDYRTTRPRVGLASLYSWSFKALSAQGAFNVQDAMRTIGMQAGQLLRADAGLLSSLSATVPVEKAIQDRLHAGYSLVRYRTQRGDETVAFMRGPLSPLEVPQPPSSAGGAWPTHSSSGTDYQILDPTTAIIDLSYSAAWQLGKTLAIADQPFRAALARLRRIIHQGAINQLKSNLAGDANRTKGAVVRSLPTTRDALSAIANAGQPQPSGNQRWIRSPGKSLHVNPAVMLRTSPEHKATYAGNVQDIAQQLAQGYDPTPGRLGAGTSTRIAAAPTAAVYNEFNAPVNTDWATVFKWVLDHMFLAGIPAHYLVSDPSYLPPESLRFFHLDANWIDALLDGALSVANQLSYDDDYIRQAIKANINVYLLQHAAMAQIPVFGFLLRSHLVAVFPDLKIEAPLPKGDTRTPNPFTQRLADDVLLVLLDRAPGDIDFSTITITQPPHQQCFRLGTHLTADQLIYDVREAFTVDVPPQHGLWQTVGNPVTVTPKQQTTPPQQQIYDWTTNVLNVPLYAMEVKQTLLAQKPTEFQDPNPATPGSAALVAIELNDSIWFLQMTSALKPGTNAPRPARQLYVGNIPRGNVVAVQATHEPPVANTSLKFTPTKIPPAPVSPRAPDMRRIRVNTRAYDQLPKPSTKFQINKYSSCGSLTDPKNDKGLLPTPLPPTDDPNALTTLVFTMYLSSTTHLPGPPLPCSEVTLSLPLDVPAFTSAFTDPIPPSIHLIPVPLLQPDISQARVLKTLGPTQLRYSAVLERSDRFLYVRLLPKAAGASKTGALFPAGDVDERLDFVLAGVKLFRPVVDTLTTAMAFIPSTVVFWEKTGSVSNQVAVQHLINCKVTYGTALV